MITSGELRMSPCDRCHEEFPAAALVACAMCDSSDLFCPACFRLHQAECAGKAYA